jgi:UDP-N-acetylglucosamine 1-carboxyvinyltransferase
MNYRISGGKKLHGEVVVNASKNASVALLAAALLNKGTTTLKKVPRIEEVKRLIEVLESIGVTVVWDDSGDVHITPPKRISLENINRAAAEKTRSIAMFIGPLAHHFDSFDLPAPTGCDLGKRSLGAHIDALRQLGIEVVGDETKHTYHVEAPAKRAAEIVMYEASDTGTENVLMAAALIPGETRIKFASSNYMVQDLCVFLQNCGVRIDGVGTSTLTVHGREEIDMDVEGYPTEDPIEAMFFVALAATTGSELSLKRVPLDFMELELATLGQMGLSYDIGTPYLSDNHHTVLVDVVVHASRLKAPPEKVAARPYPGINMDNLPFFVPVATQAEGETMIHDWVYDGRARHYMLMQELGAKMQQLDPHRVAISGPTRLHAAELDAPPALRPATLLLIGMLAAEGESILRNVYPINRGYENLHERLCALGASVEAVQD